MIHPPHHDSNDEDENPSSPAIPAVSDHDSDNIVSQEGKPNETVILDKKDQLAQKRNVIQMESK